MEHFLFRLLFEIGCSIFEALVLMAFVLKGSFCCFIPVLFASSFWERRTALDMGRSVLLAVLLLDLLSCFVGVLFESVLFFGRSVVDGDGGGGGEDGNKEEEGLVVRLTTTHHAFSSSFLSSSLLSSSIRLITPFKSVNPPSTFGSAAGLFRLGWMVDGSVLASNRSALSSFTSLLPVVVPLEAVVVFSSCWRPIPTIVASFFSVLNTDSSDDGGFCEGSRGAEFLIALSDMIR